MKALKFFEAAKAAGIESSEISERKSKKLEVNVFKGQIENFQISDSTRISARGIINGKFGVASTNKDDKLAPTFLVAEILDTAKLIEKDEKAIIFEGSKKYVKRRVFNQELYDLPAQVKIDNLLALEKKAYSLDSRVSEVEVGYSESTDERKLSNSKGLSLKSKSNYFYYFISVVARSNEQVKSNFEILLGNKPDELNVDAFAAKAVKNCVSQFNGQQCESKAYNVVLKQSVAASLVYFAVGSLSAEEIQKKSSYYIGKLNQKVASSKLTIIDKPLAKNLFFTGFDDEGVATYNKDLIKKGVLKTYLYNLETAQKDGVSSTANGQSVGSKIGIGTFFVEVKPGKLSFDQILQKVGKDGVYITDVAGLGTGINEQSGDFSLQASGYMIKDGKLAEPLTLITLSGNLFKLLADIKEVGSDSEIQYTGVSSPSLLISKLTVSGK